MTDQEKEKVLALPADIAPAAEFSRLDAVLACAGAVLFTGLAVGFFGNLSSNAMCFRYIGCNAGFFGYDAIFEHFLAGGFSAIFAVWLMKRHDRINFLSDTFLKNVIILFAVVALIGVGWEMMEFSHDALVTNGYLTNPIFLTHSMFQPSNADTMGDLTFDLLGGGLAISILKKLGIL